MSHTIKVRTTDRINTEVLSERHHISGMVPSHCPHNLCNKIIQFGFMMDSLVEIVIWKDQLKSSMKII
jgi:hypothetical protein